MVKYRIAVLSFCFLSLLCGALFAKEMILTTLDGIKIVLKEDNTWVLQSGKQPSFERDFTVPVSGGKFVLVATDGTWGFVEKELVYQEDQVRTDSIVGNGHSVNKDVLVANAEAQKQAISQVNTKMRNALVKLKIDQKLLGDCVKRAEKDVTKKEDFKQGVGWDVAVRIFVDRGSILAIADCAMKKEDESADSTAKASGSKKKAQKKPAAK
jgi:hypothetical protein